MDMTPERLQCLRVIAWADGEMNHDDTSLAPFCDDRSTLTKPDVFNQCHNAGWLKSWHDDRMDSSRVVLTDEGRAAMARALNQQCTRDSDAKG